jgi:hypothetical protein
MDSLKVLDPEGPIREADIVRPPQQVRLVTTAGKKFSLVVLSQTVAVI